MPNCINLPRIAVERFSLELNPKKCAWISIQEPDCKGVTYSHVTNQFLDKLNNLKIKFWDLREAIEYGGEICHPPSKEDAKTIVDFILANDGKNFMVNCAAGVSRSGAICKFLEEEMGYNWTLEGKNCSTPNLLLFDLMRNYHKSV